ncbi:MAG: hypothetical protein ABIK13_01895 [Patescibacteria group bacterium]
MTRLVALFLALVVFGAGCDDKDMDRKKTDADDPRPVLSGLALITEVNDIDGHPLTTTDAAYRWRLTTLLPPTFSDGRGIYRGAKPDESIVVQLGVAGTPSQDLETFRAIESITDIETGALGDWSVAAARDTDRDRTVVRATREDGSPDAYHVIECLSDVHSDRSFWEGCRLFILNARVDRTVPVPVPTPNP